MPLSPSAGWVAAVLAASALAWSVPASAATPPKKDETMVREIAIVVNGDELSRDPAPRIVGGRLVVPVVRIFSALGISVARNGNEVVASAPSGRIVLHVGSSRAAIDSRSVAMDIPAQEIPGATYVSLRFLPDPLGPPVSYDAKD